MPILNNHPSIHPYVSFRMIKPVGGDIGAVCHGECVNNHPSIHPHVSFRMIKPVGSDIGAVCHGECVNNAIGNLLPIPPTAPSVAIRYVYRYTLLPLPLPLLKEDNAIVFFCCYSSEKRQVSSALYWFQIVSHGLQCNHAKTVKCELK